MWRRVTDPAAWDDDLRRFDWPHVLQSWAWGEFKSRWGWSAERWQSVDAAGRPEAMVQLLRRSPGRLPLCVLYAPKGPTVRPDAGVFHSTLAWLEQQARARRAVWVKLDGDMLSPGLDLAQAREALSARRWRLSPEQVQFRNTAFSDLDVTDEELLSRMKPKWRYNIRLAERRGVRVRQASAADEALLYELYAETGRRDGFIIREPAYYQDAWRSMQAAGFIAELDGRPLAGLVLFVFHRRAWYFYGMSRSEGREHMPNHLLQWTAMRWARDHGCTTYDWWGAPDVLDESDPLYGVYRFKEGFGVRLVEGLGAWDYVPNPWLDRLYRRVYQVAIGR